MEKTLSPSPEGSIIIDTFRTRGAVHGSSWNYWATFNVKKTLDNSRTVDDVVQIGPESSIDSLTKQILGDRILDYSHGSNHKLTSTVDQCIYQGTQIDRLNPDELQDLHRNLYSLVLEAQATRR